MKQVLAPWLRTGALAVAAVALLAGAPMRSHAGTLVGVYEKSGFEYLVNLGDSASLSSVTYDANVPEFGGSTSGASFAVVGVVNRNLTDSLSLGIGNVIFSTQATPSGITDSAITQAQAYVAGLGTADSWFDLISSIVGGGVGAHTTISATAPNAFEKKVGNSFFNAFPFSLTGTIAGDGSLDISLYSAIAADPFDATPQVISRINGLHVSSTGVSVPEPASLVFAGIALAVTATLRRRRSA